MKQRLWRWIAALVLVAVMAPAARAEDTNQIPFLEKKVPVGITFISYGGQVFRIGTPVALNATFSTTAPNLIKISVVAAPGATLPNAPGYGSKLYIFWVTYETDIYEGELPMTGPVETTVNTEGGFVDR